MVARAFSSRKTLERLPAVQCIHLLKNPQGAVLGAQNGAVPQSLWRHETGPRWGLWHSPNPTSVEQPHKVDN